MSKKHITIDYCVFSSDKYEQMNYLAEIYNLPYSDLLRKLVCDKYEEVTQRRQEACQTIFLFNVGVFSNLLIVVWKAEWRSPVLDYLVEIYNLSYSDLLRKLVTDKYMEETQRRRDSWRNPYRRAATVK